MCVVCTCSERKWGTVEIRKRITQGGGLPGLRCPFQFPDFRSATSSPPSPYWEGGAGGEDSTTLGMFCHGSAIARGLTEVRGG